MFEAIKRGYVYLTITLMVLGIWFVYDAINMATARMETRAKVEQIQHEAGQAVSVKILALAKRSMYNPMNGPETSTKFGRLECLVGLMYNSKAPSHCWTPVYETLQEIKVSYMFALGHEGWIGGIDSVQAEKIAKQDADFQYALELEQGLSKLFDLDFNVENATSLRDLKVIEERIEFEKQELEKLLNRQRPVSIFMEEPTLRPPKVEMPAPPKDNPTIPNDRTA